MTVDHKDCVAAGYVTTITAPRSAWDPTHYCQQHDEFYRVDPPGTAAQIRMSSRPRAPYPLREHCRRGHRYTPETTGSAGTGYRRCLICARAAYRRRRYPLSSAS